MFAPVGYLPLSEVYCRFVSASYEIGSHEDVLNTLNEDYETPYSKWQISLNSEARRFFPYWSIWWLCSSPDFPTYLCSPTGKILRVSHSFFLFADGGVSSIDHFIFPVIEEDEVHRVIDDMHEDPLTDREKMNRDDCFTVCLKTGRVRTLDAMRAIAVQQINTANETSKLRVQQLLDALEAAGGPADGKPLNWAPTVAKPINEQFDDELFVSASRFAGWSVCFSESDIPEEDADLLRLVPFTRNPKRAAATEESTAEDITEKIVELYDNGVPVIRDVIKRTLASDMKEEEWRATWRAATQLRPALSRRGPKGRKRA